MSLLSSLHFLCVTVISCIIEEHTSYFLLTNKGQTLVFFNLADVALEIFSAILDYYY